ncbi:MAG: hypothetical protein ABI587_12145 [Gemmatimonadales bacterium]
MLRLLVALLLLSTPLLAQSGVYESTGNGELITGDGIATQEIDRVRLTLDAGSILAVEVGHDRQAWKFEGTWSGDPAGGDITFRINGGFGRSARGSGRATLRGSASLDRVSFEGSNRDGEFTLTFGAKGGSGTGVATSIDLNRGQFTTTRGGEGTLTIGGESERLNQSRVKVLRNGTMQLRVWGRKQYTFTGQWTGPLTNASITVDLDAYGSHDAEITGSITTSRKNGWDLIDLSGTVRGDPFTLAFDASGLPLESTDEDAADDDSFGHPVEKLAVTMVGEGDLRLNGRTTGTLVATRADLRRDGRAILAIQGAEERITLAGTWTQRGVSATIDLKISEGFGTSGTSGSGTLLLRDDKSFSGADLTGTSSAGTWVIGFRGRKPGKLPSDTAGQLNALSDSVSGSGTLAVPAQETQVVTAVRVELAANFTATIDVTGPTPTRFLGRWSRTAEPGRIALTIKGGTLTAARGSGTIELTPDRRVAAVTIDASMLHRLVKLRFTASHNR